MKKWFKKTIIGLSAIGACAIVPLAVVSCSSGTQQSNNSSNSNSNNSSNKNSNNASGSTSSQVSYIPYSKLTTTVTKEASFNDALANWTQMWNALTNTNKKYLTLVNNDVNACLNYSQEKSQNITAPRFSDGLQETTTESFSNLKISETNNLFNISFDIECQISLNVNNNNYPNAIIMNFTEQYNSSTLKPYVVSFGSFHWNAHESSNSIYYGGWYISNCLYSQTASLGELSSQASSNSIIISFYNGIKSQLPRMNVSNVKNQITPNQQTMHCGIPFDFIQNNDAIFITSIDYGINYGNLKVANPNN